MKSLEDSHHGGCIEVRKEYKRDKDRDGAGHGRLIETRNGRTGIDGGYLSLAFATTLLFFRSVMLANHTSSGLSVRSTAWVNPRRFPLCFFPAIIRDTSYLDFQRVAKKARAGSE